jgi:hypothetical protein
METTMSNILPSAPTATGEFQAQFGSPPGSSDLTAECKKWEKLCGELLADRQKLREELAKLRAERDAYYKALMRAECENYVCPHSKEELFANAIYEPTIPELLAELEKRQEG